MTARLGSTQVQIIIALATMLLVLTVVVRASSAAFSGVTSNDGNAFVTGELSLDSNVATAMFDIENMVPGQTETRCVTVTYNGSIPNPAPVKLYSTGYTDTGTLGSWLRLSIEEGTGATDVNCTGFGSPSSIRSEVTLAAFDTASVDYSTGVGAWDPSATGQSRSYRFTVKLDTATPAAQEGQSVTDLGLTWEVQS